MRKFMNKLLILLIIFLLSVQTVAANEAAPYSKSLLVFQGGKEIKFSRHYGTEQLIYRLKMAYPADDVLSFLKKELKAQGWSPIEDDFLNPGNKSSHVEGWTNFIDGARKIDHKVFQWLAQWQNANGDIAWYALIYEYPLNGPQDFLNLKIFGKYIPVEEYKQMLKEINNLIPSNHGVK